MLRTPTHIAQKNPEEVEQKVVELVLFVSRLRKQQNYTHIYAADETAVHYAASRTKTVEKRGAKSARNW